MRILFVLAMAVSVFVPGTRSATLIGNGATWSWRPGTNEASTPVEAWRSLGFNDSQFISAPAPFWYGDVLSGGTQITGMQNVYGCIFLRKTFVVTNLAEIGGLRMGSLVDDGFVSWINGTEVLRINMNGAPGTAVSTATLAINQAVDPAVFTTNTLPTPPSYLVLGTNILAVQVFQSALSSSDLGFDCSLESIVSETNPPTVLSVTPVPGMITNLTQITVTFSEPVSGVAAAHLLVNGVGAASLATLDSSTYTFGFVQPPYGNVAITWSAVHNIYDQALPPNRFNATGPGATWNYTLVDNTTPSIAALTPSADATVRSLNNITVLFSEPVLGVNAADLLINNSPASSVTSVAGIEYLFSFAQPATGLVQVAWAASHGITDQAAPPNAFAGGNWTYRLDPNAADDPPYISEFMASSTRTNGAGSLLDEDRETSDWIEIYNPSGVAVNLDGWYLTDSINDLTKWRFPATNLSGGGFLVVFASAKDRRVPGAQLHTSFSLSAGGEYLALVKPDGVTVTSEFRPVYPQQMPDVSYGFAQSGSPPGYTTSAESVYFTTATPGTVNLGGTAVPGPVIEDVKHTPNVPLDHEDLLVTARVRPSFRAVGSVSMRYRIMFSNEVTTPMFDDGAHGDGAANDGVYGATIPANLSTNGQMIRYYITATDLTAAASRWPLFTSPTGSEEYLGTIVDPTNVTSKLPIFHLFAPPNVLQPGPTTSQLGADSESGGRISLFYDGEFYDNIYMELRGNTSAGLNKKAHRLEFNRGHEFRHAGPGPRTKKSSLLGEYLDPAYLRQQLCFWFLNNVGVPAPYDYPVRLQLNGRFYQLAFHNDVIGQEQIERLGYDPRGALYKAVGCFKSDFFSTGVYQKLEPDNDPSRTDYLAVANGIVETATATVRRNTVFDLLDVPEVINYLVGARWCSENDDVWANMSMYRDTFGDQLWRVIPFDMNASWGQRYGGISPLDATLDSCKSHPLYGGSGTPACDAPGAPNNFNRLYDVIYALPETRQMFLRRMRTIMDQWIQPPETSADQLIIESYIKFMTNQISVEANLDRVFWGFSPWASGKTFNDGVGDLLNQFVGPRRRHFYVTHSVTNTSRPIGITSASNAGIPLSQPLNVSFNVIGVDFNPAGGNQEQEYVCISNTTPFAIDITGWKLAGGIDFTFTPGTVLPSNGVAYVSPNTRQFRARTTGPRGGQGLFVLGPYKGQLSARGESIQVRNAIGQTLQNFTYPGAPSVAQQFLRVTEIMYHPSLLVGNTNSPEEFEYIELRNTSPNTTLSLAGVRFINGIEFDFTGSAVTSLDPGARVLVVKNGAAFAARYGAGLPVAGQYVGNLDNAGERVQLLDSSNEEILDFDYESDWYPMTDGHGFSLVVVNENAEPDLWNSKTNWRASGQPAGSPGIADPAPPTFAPVIINEVLTRTDTPPPTDSIELYNPSGSPADIGGWYLTDDFNTPKKFRIPNGTTIAAGGFLVFNESQFNTPTNAPTSFALSSSGDEVYLFSADLVGNLTGYLDGFSFGAADDQVSFGRYTTSTGRRDAVALDQLTLNAVNSGPKIGPIVISEIMYHPPDNADSSDNAADEFIELLNTTGAAVPLYDPAASTNTWKITGGVDFDFPTNQSLAAGAYLLLVNFDPTTNTALTAAFRTKYGVGGGVALYGPYSGKLNNDGDEIRLRKPAPAVAGVVPYVLVDAVDYSDTAPWPAAADGSGASLQRLNVSAYGNDPANWTAAGASAAGALGSGGVGTAPTVTTQPSSQTVLAGSPATLAVTAAGTAALQYQWRRNGSIVPGATSAVLSIAAAQGSDAGDYSVLVYNAFGSTVSSNATLTIPYPAAIFFQPQSVQVRVRPDPAAASMTNASFGISAFSSSPLRYQWYFTGIDNPILGATNSTLTISNVQVANGGAYFVSVTDDIGTIVSAPATLYPLVSPTIVLPPLSQTVPVGATVTLGAMASGNPLPLSFEWRRFSATVASNTVNSYANFYTFTAPNIVTSLTYRVIVRNLANQGLNANASITVATVADSDGDGIPDFYEAAYGAGGQLDPAVDSDGDKMSNLAEYIAGTDPTNPLSYLKVDLLSAGPGATLQFNAASNKTYTVQFTDALGSGLWQRLVDVVGQTNAHTEVITDPAGTSNRVYRLVTPQQP